MEHRGDEQKPMDDRALQGFELIESSYRGLFGDSLGEGADLAERARWVYLDAPFSLLAYETSGDTSGERKFTYANSTAQRCFEYSWDELIGMPSQELAPKDQRPNRDLLISQVEQRGYVRDIRGIRVAKSGRLFMVEDVLVWNLMDAAGLWCGQAAKFPRWSSVDA